MWINVLQEVIAVIMLFGLCITVIVLSLVQALTFKKSIKGPLYLVAAGVWFAASLKLAELLGMF